MAAAIGALLKGILPTIGRAGAKIAGSAVGKIGAQVAGNKLVKIAAPAILGEGANQLLKRTVFKSDKKGGKLNR